MTRKTLLKLAAIICGLSGLVIILGIVFTLVSYESTSKQRFQSLISPETKGVSTSNNDLDNQRDYSKASSWFVGGASRTDFGNTKIGFYTLSIPKLKIDSATVAIGGEDLSESLIQYPGTALPGKIGNAVIFGHSVLPFFFNPGDYMTIFSTLPTLKKGDEIKVNYDGISFTYRVEEMFEVLPTDLQVLEQDTSDSFLTLVTCVPPGDPRKPKRLIIRARVVPLGERTNENYRT